MTIFVSALAFLLFVYTIKHLSTNKASVFNNAMLVISAVIACFVLDEIHTIVCLLSMVIVGLFLSQINRAKFKYAGRGVKVVF